MVASDAEAKRVVKLLGFLLENKYTSRVIDITYADCKEGADVNVNDRLAKPNQIWHLNAKGQIVSEMNKNLCIAEVKGNIVLASTDTRSFCTLDGQLLKTAKGLVIFHFKRICTY